METLFTLALDVTHCTVEGDLAATSHIAHKRKLRWRPQKLALILEYAAMWKRVFVEDMQKYLKQVLKEE